MEVLGLALVGMPGARLAESTVLPRDISSRFGLIARGGPLYSSSAVLWDKSIIPVVHVVDRIGSSRRIWVRCGTDAGPIYIACVYLPPLPSQGSDDQWLSEISGLDEDIAAVRTVFGARAQIFVMGDFNVEPREIGAASCSSSARHRAREGRWSQSYKQWGLALLNPSLQSERHSGTWSSYHCVRDP